MKVDIKKDPIKIDWTKPQLMAHVDNSDIIVLYNNSNDSNNLTFNAVIINHPDQDIGSQVLHLMKADYKPFKGKITLCNR